MGKYANLSRTQNLLTIKQLSNYGISNTLMACVLENQNFFVWQIGGTDVIQIPLSREFE